MDEDKKIINYIETKAKPFKLNERAKSKIVVLLKDYGFDVLKDCIDISFSKYIKYDDLGKITVLSFNEFFNKIGGIAHNKSLNPIEKQITYLLHIGKSAYSYWDDYRAKSLLITYVNSLKKNLWTDDQIEKDLTNEVKNLFSLNKNWSQWTDHIQKWTNDVQSWLQENKEIVSNESIIPNKLFENIQRNIKQLCLQVNSSYENNLFDCTAVIMRRLIEILLIETYIKNGLEEQIKTEEGFYLSLDKMIDLIGADKKIRFSPNTKKDLKLIKNIGNLSAHRIWYNCTQKDIDDIKLKYRIIVEELLFLSGFYENSDKISLGSL